MAYELGRWEQERGGSWAVTRNAAVLGRVATEAGFAVEGTKRQQALHLDGWHDMHAHGPVAADARSRAAVAQREA